MPKHPSDPKLQAAVAEIAAILTRYDIAGVVTVASGNGHSEYLNHIAGPSWSCLSFEDDEQGRPCIRFRSQAKSAPVHARLLERVKTKKTISAIACLRVASSYQVDMLTRLTDMVQQAMPFDVGPGVHTPGGGQ